MDGELNSNLTLILVKADYCIIMSMTDWIDEANWPLYLKSMEQGIFLMKCILNLVLMIFWKVNARFNVFKTHVKKSMMKKTFLF